MTTQRESRLFEKLAGTCGASPAGAKWLKLAIDPFHDVDLDLIGVPDETPGRSLLYNITRQVSITAPTSAGTGTWDAHVAFCPLLTDKDRSYYSTTLGGVGNVVVDSYNADVVQPVDLIAGGPLWVCAVPAATDTFVGGTNEEYTTLGFEDILDSDLSSHFRLAGAAFEVHNVTEELSKSGAVTVYRCDNTYDNADIFVDNQTLTRRTEYHDWRVVNGPPTSESAAKEYNGITWEAREGCLVPVVLDSHGGTVHHTVRRVALVGRDAADNTRICDDNDVTTCEVFFNTDGTTFSVPSTSRGLATLLPSMSSGAYFSGLSNESVLSLTLRMVVEVFPSPGSDLTPLAHPAPPYDSAAMQCYSEVMHRMHAGYPVHDNAAGDYFRKAFSALKLGSEIAGMFSPKAAAVATGLQASEDIANTLMPSKKKGKAAKSKK